MFAEKLRYKVHVNQWEALGSEGYQLCSLLLNSHVEIRNQYDIYAAVPNARRAMRGFFSPEYSHREIEERKRERERAMRQAVRFCAL